MLPAAITLKWLGHACFLITLTNGTHVVTDPFDKQVGYPLPSLSAEVVTISHEHFDHNNASLVKGKPKVLRHQQDAGIKGVRFRWVATSHDKSRGKERGANGVLVIEDHGLTICHLGDLGHVLAPEQVKAIGKADVLLIPVGGVFTIDAADAGQVVRQLKPKIVIPMHYKTSAIKFGLSGVEPFLKGKKEVERRQSDTITITRENLPKTTQIIVLQAPK